MHRTSSFLNNEKPFNVRSSHQALLLTPNWKRKSVRTTRLAHTIPGPGEQPRDAIRYRISLGEQFRGTLPTKSGFAIGTQGRSLNA